MKKKKTKSKRKKSFDKIQGNCKHTQPCDCGENILCYHPEGEYDRCIEEYCPLMKK